MYITKTRHAKIVEAANKFYDTPADPEKSYKNEHWFDITGLIQNIHFRRVIRRSKLNENIPVTIGMMILSIGIALFIANGLSPLSETGFIVPLIGATIGCVGIRVPSFITSIYTAQVKQILQSEYSQKELNYFNEWLQARYNLPPMELSKLQDLKNGYVIRHEESYHIADFVTIKEYGEVVIAPQNPFFLCDASPVDIQRYIANEKEMLRFQRKETPLSAKPVTSTDKEDIEFLNIP